MEQRDQGDERDEDRNERLVTATVIAPEELAPESGWVLWLKDHGRLKGGAEDADE